MNPLQRSTRQGRRRARQHPTENLIKVCVLWSPDRVCMPVSIQAFLALQFSAQFLNFIYRNVKLIHQHLAMLFPFLKSSNPFLEPGVGKGRVAPSHASSLRASSMQTRHRRVACGKKARFHAEHLPAKATSRARHEDIKSVPDQAAEGDSPHLRPDRPLTWQEKAFSPRDHPPQAR